MRFLKMSAVSKNPFDALPTEDDEDEPVPVKKEVKDVKKPAVAAAKPTASAAPAKEAPKSVLPVVNLNAIAALVVVVGRMGPKTNEVVLANTIGELRNQAQRRMMRQAET